jgi:serine phosphatase RsbU (regulator of sigma subunit)/integral membrane sensor domain MASE1/anti-sigma regulatory factor (Ser/Thr protein kinase)
MAASDPAQGWQADGMTGVVDAPTGVAGRRSGRRWAPLWIALAVAVAYALGSGCAWLLFRASDAGAVFFPPAGVTLGALLLVARRHWVWVLGAAGTVELAINLWQGLAPLAAGGFVLTNVVEPLAGAALLRRFRPGRVDLTRRRDALAFLGCAVGAGPLAGALIGATTSAWVMDAQWWAALTQFWAGDGLAVLTLGAAVVGLGTLRVGGWPRRIWRAAAMLTGTAGLAVVGFWPHEVPLVYLPVPLLLVAGFLGRVATVGAAGFVLAFTANLLSAAGHGPWAALADQPRLETASLQVYLACVVLGAWVLAIAVAERDRARARSRREVAARRRLQALQDVTAGLATAATSEQVTRVLVERGVGLIADHGGVALVDRRGGPLRAWPIAAGSPPATDWHAGVSLGEDGLMPITHALRTGQPVELVDLAEISARFPRYAAAAATAGTRSLLVVPIRAGERTLGALAFAFRRDGALGPEITSVARTLAELAGQAFDRAALYEAEYEAAHQLQRSLLPRIPPDLPGVRAGVCYRPAERGHDVGGDWYDVFELPGNRVGVAVGDVVGHGLTSAIAMGRLQQSLRSVAMTGASPAEVLEALDTASGAVTGAEYATVGYAEYSPADRTLTYACAGHLPPLLIAGDTVRFLDGGRSQPLRLPTGPRPQTQLEAPPGAMIVWYSDGLVERRHEVIDTGLDRLAKLAGTLTGVEPQDWCEQLLTRMTADQTVTDDIVVACLQLGDSPATADGSAVLRLTLRSPADLAPARRRLRDWSAGRELSPERVDALLTTCNEALSNALEHAYPGQRSGPVALKVVEIDRRQVRVEVTDWGRWRAAASAGEERGRGLQLINQMARRVVLDLSEHGTRVTITLPTG